MPHTYACLLFHCVFSTKERRPWLTDDIRPRLWAFVGGIARANELIAHAVGGVADHAHLLIAAPTTIPVAKAVQLVKAGSSAWLSSTFPSCNGFVWQEGYGAFSIGISQKALAVAYIGNQEEHHHKRTFQKEYLGFLRKHGVQYDERYLWG